MVTNRDATQHTLTHPTPPMQRPIAVLKLLSSIVNLKVIELSIRFCFVFQMKRDNY